MKKTARYISLILASLMILALLAGCAETTDPNAETTLAPAETAAPGVADAETTESLYDENGYLKSSLPEELDFGGETITVLWWSDIERPEFFVEEATGDMITDAIYQRNANVEAKMGITFDWVETKGQYNNGVGKAYADHVGHMYASGDST